MARVLIVDDDKDLAGIWGDALSDEGHGVDVCTNANDAVRCIELNSFDVVITDLRMPGEGGVYVTSMARVLRPGTKVVVVSGDELALQMGPLSQASELGAARTLAKPVRLDDLIDTVAELTQPDPVA